MGQLTLRDLAAIGDAAARFVQRAQSSQFWSVFIPALEPLFAQLAEGQGDCDNLEVPPPLLLSGRSHTVGRDQWSADVWLDEEYECGRDTAAWYLEVGRQGGFEDQSPRLEELSPRLGINRSRYFARFVVIWKDTSEVAPPLTVVLEPGPQAISILEVVKGHKLLNTSRSQAKKTFQALDVYSRHVAVAFDPVWSASATRTSVMAQVAEWFIRVQGSEHAPALPELSQDAVEWWARWATKAGRRGQDNALTASDVYEIAKRTLRPEIPAGHRKYWQLAARAIHDDDLATRAAKRLGIGRRTVYYRLNQGGRSVADFKEDPDPIKSLCRWLSDHSGRRLISSERKLVRDALEEAGSNKEAARKLERRLRHLPAEEQAARLRAAIQRAHERRST